MFGESIHQAPLTLLIYANRGTKVHRKYGRVNSAVVWKRAQQISAVKTPIDDGMGDRPEGN